MPPMAMAAPQQHQQLPTTSMRFTYQPSSKVSKSIGTSNGLRPSLEIVTPTTISTATATPSIGLPRSDPLPDLPPYVGPLVAAWLAFGVVAAILLFFVQFPPRCFRGDGKAKPVNRKLRPAASRDEHELDTLNATLEPPQAVSTSADSPALDNGELRPGMRKRAMQKNLSVDTSVKYVGLGIAVPGISIADHAPSPALRTRKSFDGFSSQKSYLDQSDGASSHGSASPLNKSWHVLNTPKPTAKSSHHATKSVDSQEAARSLRFRLPDDEEAGLRKPTDRRGRGFGYRTPWPTPNGSPSSSGSSSPKPSTSTVRLALEKVGDSIEWGTDKLAKLLHDQVKEDYEDGLLLPIKAPKLHAN
ncbi:uncharacterized protein MYCFIDRAFT_78893 [Pseudocercospora fijiensis CIRAD86]|uniref:Uncharacterized protein n=1 Tax=Pseudocercospora fijiensis (strain CIRAD86) TaxID=383855 RepID=M2ZRH4_PSEFD|nr:uncharacterized protein MYCFIDRAFT_78893 [Pseudocercospora fijiensis CIRAD86]EME81649.1 hypothetical protein MYCFIDRAFT_78893 [Pseudocercospora fijiensis CIRAD86]